MGWLAALVVQKFEWFIRRTIVFIFYFLALESAVVQVARASPSGKVEYVREALLLKCGIDR